MAPFSNAQRHERGKPMSIKEQILEKLDSIDLVYMSRLRTRDHFEARRRLDAIAQLVDRLTDNLRERELALSDREKALQKREMNLEDKERDREHFNERDRNRDREGDRARDKDMVRVSPISMQEFDQLLGAVEKSSFDQDKRKIVNTSSANNYFLIDQVIKLTSKFSFDKDKLDVIEILYPRILDIDKNYLLYNCFTFSDSKNKLERFMQENTPKK
jgi:hypothetical protein